MKRKLGLATIIATLLIGGCSAGTTAGAPVTPDTMAGTWQVVSGEGPSGKIDPKYAPIILVVTEDGSYTGSTGCNNYTGAFGIDEEGVTTTPVGVTTMKCASDDEDAVASMSETEVLYLDALEQTESGTASANEMRLDGVGTHITYKKVGE